jgi:hypothetical protein
MTETDTANSEQKARTRVSRANHLLLIMSQGSSSSHPASKSTTIEHEKVGGSW